MTPEQLRKLDEKTTTWKRETRERRNADELRDARMFISALVERGWSFRKIERETGIAQNAAKMILEKRRKYIKKTTADKIFAAYRRGI
jgi:hypothetical protein